METINLLLMYCVTNWFIAHHDRLRWGWGYLSTCKLNSVKAIFKFAKIFKVWWTSWSRLTPNVKLWIYIQGLRPDSFNKFHPVNEVFCSHHKPPPPRKTIRRYDAFTHLFTAFNKILGQCYVLSFLTTEQHNTTGLLLCCWRHLPIWDCCHF